MINNFSFLSLFIVYFFSFPPIYKRYKLPFYATIVVDHLKI